MDICFLTCDDSVSEVSGMTNHIFECQVFENCSDMTL